MRKTLYCILLIGALGCVSIASGQSNIATNIPPLSQLVPEDKKLDSDWVKGLTARGTPEVCTGNQLDYVDMPVSGLFSGQVTLGAMAVYILGIYSTTIE